MCEHTFKIIEPMQLSVARKGWKAERLQRYYNLTITLMYELIELSKSKMLIDGRVEIFFHGDTMSAYVSNYETSAEAKIESVSFYKPKRPSREKRTSHLATYMYKKNGAREALLYINGENFYKKKRLVNSLHPPATRNETEKVAIYRMSYNDTEAPEDAKMNSAMVLPDLLHGLVAAHDEPFICGARACAPPANPSADRIRKFVTNFHLRNAEPFLRSILPIPLLRSLDTTKPVACRLEASDRSQPGPRPGSHCAVALLAPPRVAIPFRPVS